MKNLFIATMGADFRKYAEADNLGIELDYFCMAENLDGQKYEPCCSQVSRLAEKLGFTGKDFVLHAPFNELHPAAIDPGALELLKKRMKQAYGVCERFGINKMVVHSGYMPYVYFKSWHTERSVEFWTEFMKDKPDTFRICIENVLEDEPYMMRDMIEKIRAAGGSNIGICLDIGHANCMSDVDAAEWITVLGPYISHFHLHNNDGSGDLHQPFGDGTMDVENLLKLAEEACGEDVTYTIEVMKCGEAVEWLKDRNWMQMHPGGCSE